MSNLTGIIIGYDPGGNNGHGLAKLSVKRGEPEALYVHTLANAEDVLQKIEVSSQVLGVGVDTMTCWSTGSSAWRPADKWLRDRYPAIKKSIVSPNGMYGSMGINGMSVLHELRKANGDVYVTETHPKVLCYELFKQKHNYTGNGQMDDWLAGKLKVEINTSNDHEWDAAISALAALRGLQGAWNTDLHKLPANGTGRFVHPCGKTHYVWPAA